MKKYLAEISTYSLLLVIAVMIVACGESPKQFADAPIVNEHGQTITFVKHSALYAWMDGHRHVKLVGLTGYSGDSGTHGYVVIYETPKIEK